jgi:hypothetical protein
MEKNSMSADFSMSGALEQSTSPQKKNILFGLQFKCADRDERKKNQKKLEN